MGTDIPFKITGNRDRGAFYRFFHCNRVKEKIAGKYAEGKNENSRIGRQLACCGRGKVFHIHGSSNKTVKESHDHTGCNRNKYSFSGNFF